MKNSIKVIISGSVLFAGGIIFGLGGTIINVMGAFRAISESGMGDTEAIAGNMNDALLTTTIGIPIAVIGFCLLLGGIVAYFVGKNKPDVPEQAA